MVIRKKSDLKINEFHEFLQKKAVQTMYKILKN